AAQPGATYKLMIKPWGTILVNGVNRGVSPPLKRLTLPAGQHTIRIINPSFPEHAVTVNSVKGETAIIELDFTQGGSD
ncbi:PEGA domain-containing protein, partial [Massilia sp. DD77]|uniref:PEGA domain-containing protein n=1 Tax=Massilia sp. DD77 TaxID=3109349 RepID=UPI002FFD9640